MVAVVYPAPTIPSAGIRRCPKINVQPSSALAGIASTTAIITAWAREVAASNASRTSNARKAGAPQHTADSLYGERDELLFYEIPVPCSVEEITNQRRAPNIFTGGGTRPA